MAETPLGNRPMNQRTTAHLSAEDMLNKNKLGIHEHSMLYKLSAIQKQQETNLSLS